MRHRSLHATEGCSRAVEEPVAIRLVDRFPVTLQNFLSRSPHEASRAHEALEDRLGRRRRGQRAVAPVEGCSLWSFQLKFSARRGGVIVKVRFNQGYEVALVGLLT